MVFNSFFNTERLSFIQNIIKPGFGFRWAEAVVNKTDKLVISDRKTGNPFVRQLYSVILILQNDQPAQFIILQADIPVFNSVIDNGTSLGLAGQKERGTLNKTKRVTRVFRAIIQARLIAG